MARTRDRDGLRPVQDVVGRIRFDAALDASRFTIGYEERFAGVREAPLAEFVGEGEIPWHRVWFIKAGDLVVWDRRERIDLVFGSGDSPCADLAAIQRACLPPPVTAAPAPRRRAAEPAFAAQPCHRFDPTLAEWVPAAPHLDSIDVEALQVVTFNVLFDLYEPEQIYSERRRVACLELLAAQDADLVALQEVTPTFWAELLASPWVRARYHVSTGPDAAGLRPYGQVLLSRWPLALELHTYSEHKRLLLGRLVLAGRPLTIAAVHLTSNQKDGASDKRAEQFAVLAARLAREPGDALVLGDFNFGDGDEDTQLTAAGLDDAWRRVHPHHPGFTFDPVANPLAAIMTRSGRAARYDRVLVRAPTGALAPIDVQMIGQRPFAEGGATGLYTSDHFGLCALLQVAGHARRGLATLAAAPVHRSALVLIPPESTWPPIQSIRAAHDPSHTRWMPHINLVYGFVPDAEFPAAAALVAEVVRDHPPIRVHLGELRRFDHRGSTTVWLAPVSDPPGALEALQRALAERFPNCSEQSARGPFTPHLTIARLTGSEAEIAAQVAAWQAQWRPIDLTIDALHLISRHDDEPFAVRRSLPLASAPRPAPSPSGAPDPSPMARPAPWPMARSVPPSIDSPDPRIPGLVAPPAWARIPSPRHLDAVRLVAAACMTATQATGPCLHLVGSARLGVASPDSDLDLVFAGPAAGDRTALYTSVRDHLTAAGALNDARQATSAGLPLLRMRIGGLAVDLQYAGLPAHVPAERLAELEHAALRSLEPPDRRAALACIDADAMIRLVSAHLPVEVFRDLLQRVRTWACARQLDVGAWGLLGGYSWALLTAWAAIDGVRSGAPGEPEPLLRQFFATYARWPTGRPVAFGEPPSAAATRRAPWPIYTPTPPAFNSARSLTRSTLALLQSELRRADAIVRAAHDDLQEPVDADAHPRRIVLTLLADPDAELVCRGWFDGQLLGLLLALEAQGARVRPYPRPTRDDDGLHHAIGVDGGPADPLIAAAESFAHEFAVWPDRPTGATLTTSLQTGRPR